MADIKLIGLMTCGGDCPGLNAVVRSVVIAAKRHGWDVMGIEDSMQGLIDLNYSSPYGNRLLTLEMVEDILSKGGTILGNDNHSHPFKFAMKNDETGLMEETDVSSKVIENYRKLGLDALVVVGGDGSMDIANRLSIKAGSGFNVVGVPKTIDNDLAATDFTFGFDTAVQTITEALDRIRDTARSHDRTLIVECMGRDAGFLSLYGGMAGGANCILIPEIPYNIEAVANTIIKRRKNRTPFTIIVIAEGAKPQDGDVSQIEKRVAGEMCRYRGAGEKLQHALQDFGVPGANDIRTSVLGYIQRGGSPSSFDRILGSRLGEFAVQLVYQKKWSHMAALRTPDIVAAPFSTACAGQKLVDPQGQLVQTARTLGICLGE
eukprot:TRINITY_DN12545_c0_g1_i1.p1 TRINITY_DN12545_c0_g1~~TRINITY_DN12545_c0_g1_i1.p1  ORF type:complete len:396 (-),score=80.02 TRINITY_DN12545_c0_g1_i1:116-1243(-)